MGIHAGAAPVLLTMAGYYGSLAAVRSLGRANVPVVVAESRWLVPARWSRYVSRRVRCPPVARTEAFLEWLLAFGRASPGMVLYPTSDDLAWLFAMHRADLAKDFRLFHPPVEAVYAVLNKRRLSEACAAVGLLTAETHFPRDEADAVRCASGLEYPLLLKPQTQILFESRVKGRRVPDAASLGHAYRAYLRDHRHGAALLRYDPSVATPMLQRFHAEAAENIYSISGFVDADGDHALRAATKVLQQPRTLGVGLCFEAAPVDAHLARGVLSLCKHVGYHGVFEVEFIRAGGRHLLIDFNPRYYGQMAFETSRRLPLPELTYAAALGDGALVRSELARARRADGDGDAPTAYCHRLSFELMLGLQRLSRRFTATEHRQWRDWQRRNRRRTTDAVLAADDPMPMLVEALAQLRRAVRHPRAFAREMILDRHRS